MMIYCCAEWGSGLVSLAWAFWWIDVVLSLATCITMPFIVMERHKPTLNNVSAALLLPIVPVVVAAASGGIVASALPDPGHALATLVTSYILWGIGQCMSGMVIALYFHRLTIHAMPPKEIVITTFLPIGPLGQGGFGVQQLGKVAVSIASRTSIFDNIMLDPMRGAETLYVIGVFCAMVMWGFAMVWMAYAAFSLYRTRHFPFNMGWWGLTFPLGVLTTCTSLLAQDLDSIFFRVMTMVSVSFGFPSTCVGPWLTL